MIENIANVLNNIYELLSSRIFLTLIEINEKLDKKHEPKEEPDLVTPKPKATKLWLEEVKLNALCTSNEMNCVDCVALSVICDTLTEQNNKIKHTESVIHETIQIISESCYNCHYENDYYCKRECKTGKILKLLTQGAKKDE